MTVLTEEQEKAVRKAVSGMSVHELQSVIEVDGKIKDSDELNPLFSYVPNRIQEAFHNSSKMSRWLFGANMSGKTVAGAKEAVCWLLGEDPSGTTTKSYRRPPVRGWAGGPDLKVAENVLLTELLNWMPRDALSAKHYHAATQTLKLKNGSSLTLKSYDSYVEKWQGEPIDFGWLDEQPPHPHFSELESRVNRRGGSIWGTLTLLYENSSWIYDIIFENERDDPEIEKFMAILEDNFHLPKEYMIRQHQAFDGTEEEAPRLRGEPVRLSNVVHPGFHVGVHVINPLQLDETFSYARVIDLHQRAPNTCNWFAWKDDPPTVYVIDELSMKDKTIGEFGKAIIYRSELLPLQEVFTIVDTPESTSDIVLGTSMRTELAKMGIAPIDPNRNFFLARERTNEYIEYVEKGIKSPRFFIFNTCQRTIRGIRRYAWDNWRGGGSYDKNPKEKPRMKDDHEVRNCHYFMATMPTLSEAKREINRHRNTQRNTRGYRIPNRNYQRGLKVYG